MRFLPAALLVHIGVAAMTAPVCARAQEAEPAPSTTQSQSGYPDIRKEAADPSLFPNPDEPAANAARPTTPRGNRAPEASGGRSGRAGARLNNQIQRQADTDPLPVRIAYRRAKTMAMSRNPQLQVLLKQASAAETDDEKRRYLRIYYVQLFNQVRKLDSSRAMKSHLDLLKRVTEQRYDPKRRTVAGEEDLISGRGYGRRDRVR